MKFKNDPFMIAMRRLNIFGQFSHRLGVVVILVFGMDQLTLPNWIKFDLVQLAGFHQVLT